MSLKFIEATQSGDFICNKHIFNELFDKETRKLPLCVLCITGIFRGGKSFFLNLVMRYLRYLARGGRRESEFSSIPEWVKGEGKYIDGYIKQESRSMRKITQTVQKESKTSENGVGVKGGEKPVTTGIDFVKELFVIPDPQNPTRKICILLMDTQGLWDPNTDSKCNGSIFGLSCTLSSYLIFNHMGVLSSENLSQLATLTDFSSGLAKIQCQGKKAFQQLTILFRDCKDIDTDATREEANKIMSVKKNELINSPAYKKHTDKLQECFEGFDAMYICKPGDIDTREYNGDLDEVNDLFFVLMGHFIEDIFMKIRPRIIGGEEVTGKTFVKYAMNFSNLFRNEDTFPDSSMVMDAACDVTNSKLIENSATEFESQLSKYTKGSAPKDANELERYCNNEKNKRLQLFNSISKGSLVLKNKSQKELDYQLTNIVKNYQAMNERKAVLYEKIMDVYDEAKEVYFVRMKERIPNLLIEESEIDSIHREVANQSLELLNKVTNDMDDLKKLFVEFAEYKNNLLAERRLKIRQMGVKVIADKEDELNSLDEYSIEITIPQNTMFTIENWNVNQYDRLKVLRINSGSLRKLKSFSLSYLKNLTTVDIGDNCCTFAMNKTGNAIEKSFSITNCDNLVSITIGSYSFSDYAGGFTLKYLPSLKTLKLASTNQVSCSFYNSDVTISECRKLQSIEMGGEAFGNTNYCKLENLTNLSQINMGLAAIKGRMNTATLIMTNLPYLHYIISKGQSFTLISNVTLSDIATVSEVQLKDSFEKASKQDLHNIAKPLRACFNVDDMMREMTTELCSFKNYSFSDSTKQELNTILIEWNNYHHYEYTHSQRQEFYCNICYKVVECLMKCIHSFSIKRNNKLQSLPQTSKEIFMYNLKSKTTYAKTRKAINEEFQKDIKDYKSVIMKFESIVLNH